jgi:predicted transcriptional regulator
MKDVHNSWTGFANCSDQYCEDCVFHFESFRYLYPLQDKQQWLAILSSRACKKMYHSANDCKLQDLAAPQYHVLFPIRTVHSLFMHIADNYIMKQRGKFSLTTLILSAVTSAGDKGITKTKLMQELVLNHSRINRYCGHLVSADLITCDSGTRYRITQKGAQYLRLSQELADYILPIHEMIVKYENIFDPEQSHYRSNVPVTLL